MDERCDRYKIIVEKMHFDNPRNIILYLIFGDVLYLSLSYFGGRLDKLFSEDKLFFLVQIGIIYIAFTIKDFINKIYVFLEIDKKGNEISPLRKLFISEDAFLKYKNEIIYKIFSKQLHYSIIFIILLATTSFYYNLIITNNFGKTFHSETRDIWGILIWILYYYLYWWVLFFAGFCIFFTLFQLIIGLIKLKDADGLKINESSKSLKKLMEIKNYDEKTIKNSLNGYYTYNTFLKDAEEITEFSLYLAVRVAILAALSSIGWIGIAGILFNEWNIILLFLVILMDFFAILIFIIPPYCIHKILKVTKSEMSQTIYDVYEMNKVFVIARAAFFRAEENSIKSVQFLKSMVDEINKLNTWSIELKSISKITLSILPTIASTLLQIFYGN